MTLKQSQGPQTYNENVNPKQGYNQAHFSRSCFNDVHKNKTFFFFSNKEISQLSPFNVYEKKEKKKWYTKDLLDKSKVVQSSNLIRQEQKFQVETVDTAMIFK